MLFDEAPKMNRSDLYDFQEEQDSFRRALDEEARLVTIVGLRRTGGTHPWEGVGPVLRIISHSELNPSDFHHTNPNPTGRV